MKKLILSLLIITTSLQAAKSDTQQVMRQTYLKAFKHATINCEYRYWLKVKEVEVISQEFHPGSKAQAQFRIGEDILSLVATAGGNKGSVDFRVNGEKFETELLNLDGIGIELDNLNPRQSQLAKKLDLQNLTCSLEIAREDHHVITHDTFHINMHPHPGYDVDGESIPGMVRELNNESYEHLVLFDDNVKNLIRARKANFNELILENKTDLELPENFGVPPFEIPPYAATKLSQAGHNRFIMQNPVQKIVFTGGNHNFCIINNTRRLLHAFMENPARESLTFDYITDAIVVQKGSWLRGGKIPGRVFRKSNLLKTVFENMSSKQREKYVRAHFDYFKNSYLNEKKYYFSRAILRTRGVHGFDFHEAVKGELPQGEKEITINFNYL